MLKFIFDNPHRSIKILWSFIAAFTFFSLLGVIIYIRSTFTQESAAAFQAAQSANNAFVEHTKRVISEIDTLLRAARDIYQRTRSDSETEKFIDSLSIDRIYLADIYVMDAEATVRTPFRDRDKVTRAKERDYYNFHRNNAKDELFISSVSLGQATGKQQFRITRRIYNADGSFGGIVIIPVEPTAFSGYYQKLLTSKNHLATLVGTGDHLVRARSPIPDGEYWAKPVTSPLWDLVSQQSSGSYTSKSGIDGVERTFIYQRIGELPLVMVTGYSMGDVRDATLERIKLPLLASIFFLSLVVLLTAMLTMAIRKRAAMAVLLADFREVNERNTALFDATQDGIVLLDGSKIIDCNQMIIAMLNLRDKEQLLAWPPWCAEFTPAYQTDGRGTRSFAEDQIRIAMEMGTNRFVYLLRKIGSEKIFPSELMLTAIQFRGRTILQAVVRDMTERVRHEEELTAINARLAERNEEQARFLSMLIHELKTPMSVIRMSLESTAMPKDVQERVTRSILDMDAVLNRCQESDRLQHGQVEYKPERCELRALLDSLRASSSDPARVDIVFDAPSDCTSDSQLLGIVLTNLIDNGLKYGAKTAPVNLSVTQCEEDGNDGLCIAIRNLPGSAGMPDPTRVFRKYYRAPGAHGKTGSGLGLHLAEGFSRMIGGRLSYQPKDHLVQFVLWIPR